MGRPRSESSLATWKASNPREYGSWRKMMSRCNAKNDKDYPRYGGRGISVCARWTRVNLFIEDMGPRPTGTTIDRLDFNGDYEPGNCRWATPIQQGENRRNNVFLLVDGVARRRIDLIKETGMGEVALMRRFQRVSEVTAPPVSSPAGAVIEDYFLITKHKGKTRGTRTAAPAKLVAVPSREPDHARKAA